MQCEQGVWRSHWGRRWQEGEESAGQEKEFGLTRLDDDDRRKDRPSQTHLLFATVALDAAEVDLETANASCQLVLLDVWFWEQEEGSRWGKGGRAN